MKFYNFNIASAYTFVQNNKFSILIYSSLWWHISLAPGILGPKETQLSNALAYVPPPIAWGSKLDLL